MSQASLRHSYLPETPHWQSIVIGVIVLGACIVGIGTRWLFDLASFWPANAVLFCILVLRPDTNRALTWIMAMSAFLAADLIAGSDIMKSLLLNAANITGVAAGVVACRATSISVHRLNRPSDAIVIILILALAAAATAAVGGLVGPILFDLSLTDSLALWFSTEFVNYALVFPVMAALASSDEQRFRIISRNRPVALRQGAALVFLAVSYLSVHFMGGPGAITYILPGLGWIALRFRPLTAATITLVVCAGLLISGQNGNLQLHFDINNVANTASFRFGVAMVAIIAFAMATLNAAWRRVHLDLQVTSRHDALTGLLNRAAFLERAQAALDLRRADDPISLLMIDIDHFKSVNDRFGHGGGDQALATTARALAKGLRGNDIIGRLGGEEFAVILPGVDAASAQAAAERLRRAVENTRIVLPDGVKLAVTVSIGAAETRSPEVLANLLSAADAALYAAKHAGRNRVIVVSSGDRVD